MKAPSRSWVLLQIVSGAVLSVLLGWLMIRGMDWNELFSNIREFPAHLFLLALVTFLLGILLRAWRWHVLFVRERPNFLRLFLIQNAGIGLNNLSPIRIFSEPVQLALVTRRGGVNGGTALATLATEHLMDVFATATFLGLGVILLPELRGFSIQLAGAIILAVASLLVFLIIAKGMNFIPGARKVVFIQRALTAARILRDSPFHIFLSLLGTFGHWALLGISGWIIAQGLGIDVGIAVVVVLFMGSVFFVSAVPSLPGGAITFEAAVVYTLGLFGVEGEPALVFALVMHIVMFGPSTIIAALVLPREGIKMFGRKDSAVLVIPKDEQVY
ncbi:flippase-like domain-containing protein [Dehalococcoidia bacterium]|nr:flippase-like domain-containing protein [Dehalococcoidia bacterium]